MVSEPKSDPFINFVGKFNAVLPRIQPFDHRSLRVSSVDTLLGGLEVYVQHKVY